MLFPKLRNRLTRIRSFSSSPSLLTAVSLLSTPSLPFNTLLKTHALIITVGDSTNPFLAAKLISLYASFHLPDIAGHLFATFPVSRRDAFLWNAVIKAHFSNSDFASALRLFSLMLASGVAPDHFTVPMAASACAEMGFIRLGVSIHGNCVKNGFLGPYLVYLYAKCGAIGDARQVFDETPLRDVVSWTAVVVGCARNGEFEMGLTLLRDMVRGDRMRPNSRTVDGGLQACAGLTALQEGKCLHGFALKSGIGCCEAVKSSLLNMYYKCETLVDVVLVFEELLEKDVVSWTTVASVYARRGLVAECLELYQRMIDSGLELDGVFVSCLVMGFANAGSVASGRAFQGVLLRRNFVCNVLVSNALLSMYCKFKQVKIAENVFHNMVERNGESWNLLVHGYGKIGFFMKCLDLFRQMQLRGSSLQYDCNSLSSVIYSCSQLGALSLGKSVHCCALKVIVGGDVSSVYNALVHMYGRYGRLDLARRIFDGMSRDVIMWNALITSYSHLGHSSDALLLFDQMLAEDVTPNSTTLISVLSSCSNIAALHCGMWVHNLIRQMGLEYDVSLCTALVDMYAKCGQLETSREVFDSMPEKDVISWNAMIAAYGIHGYAKEALDVFKQMEDSGVKPNEVTFLAVLSACSHGGLVEEGNDLFARMEEYAIVPTIKHYACVVDILGRSGNLHEAEAMVHSMPMEPDGGIWGALLGACKMHNNVVIGERVAQMAFESDPENDGYYTLLSNIYSCAGRWEEVERLRDMMKIRGVRKTAGWSALELYGTVLTFTAGDLSHAQSELMQFVLESLCKHMEEICCQIETDSPFQCGVT